MTPPPAAIMCGVTARVQRKTPLRFTPMTASHCSSVIVAWTAPSLYLTSWASRTIPALFTRTSTRPHFAITSATAPATDAASATFTFAANASAAPAAFSSSTRALASATSQAATFAPSLANLRAVARPIPAAAPVTMTARPASPDSMLMMEPLLPRALRPRSRPRRGRGEDPAGRETRPPDVSTRALRPRRRTSRRAGSRGTAGSRSACRSSRWPSRPRPGWRGSGRTGTRRRRSRRRRSSWS